MPGAVCCLALPRPRQVLTTIVGVSAAGDSLSRPICGSAFSADRSLSTAADEWFYVDAFSAFHLIVLALVFVLSSAFAGVYFADEAGDHAFRPPSPAASARCGSAR